MSTTDNRLNGSGHQLGWTPGSEGKGYVTNQGVMHTWDTISGAPHHPDYLFGLEPNQFDWTHYDKSRELTHPFVIYDDGTYQYTTDQEDNKPAPPVQPHEIDPRLSVSPLEGEWRFGAIEDGDSRQHPDMLHDHPMGAVDIFQAKPEDAEEWSEDGTLFRVGPHWYDSVDGDLVPGHHKVTPVEPSPDRDPHVQFGNDTAFTSKLAWEFNGPWEGQNPEATPKQWNVQIHDEATGALDPDLVTKGSRPILYFPDKGIAHVGAPDRYHADLSRHLGIGYTGSQHGRAFLEDHTIGSYENTPRGLMEATAQALNEHEGHNNWHVPAEEEDEFKFGNDFAADHKWQPGAPGKGMIVNNRPVTWNIRETPFGMGGKPQYAGPHHADVLLGMGVDEDSQDWDTPVYINKHGDVFSMGYWPEVTNYGLEPFRDLGLNPVEEEQEKWKWGKTAVTIPDEIHGTRDLYEWMPWIQVDRQRYHPVDPNDDWDLHAQVANDHGLRADELTNATFGRYQNDGRGNFVDYVVAEPFGETVPNRVQDEISLWNREYPDHDWKFAASLGPRCVMLKDGQIISDPDAFSHYKLCVKNGIDPDDVTQYGYLSPVNGKPEWYSNPADVGQSIKGLIRQFGSRLAKGQSADEGAKGSRPKTRSDEPQSWSDWVFGDTPAAQESRQREHDDNGDTHPLTPHSNLTPHDAPLSPTNTDDPSPPLVSLPAEPDSGAYGEGNIAPSASSLAQFLASLTPSETQDDGSPYPIDSGREKGLDDGSSPASYFERTKDRQQRVLKAMGHSASTQSGPRQDTKGLTAGAGRRGTAPRDSRPSFKEIPTVDNSWYAIQRPDSPDRNDYDNQESQWNLKVGSGAGAIQEIPVEPYDDSTHWPYLEIYAGDDPATAHGFMEGSPHDVWKFQAPEMNHHDQMEYGDAYVMQGFDVPPHRITPHMLWEDNPANPDRKESQGTPGREGRRIVANETLKWNPGNTGKGFSAGGKLYTWNTSGNKPHHYDMWRHFMKQDYSIPVMEAAFAIDHQGQVTPEYGDPADYADALAQDPRLNHNETAWKFGSLQAIVPPVGASRISEPPLPWQKGHEGKGLVVGGQPYLWSIKQPGAPHHPDVLMKLNPEYRGSGIVEKSEGLYTIDPDGRVHQSDLWGHGDPQIFAASHPDLYHQEDADEWKFGAFGKISDEKTWNVVQSDFDPSQTFYPESAGNPSRTDQRVTIAHPATREIFVGKPGTHHGDLIHHHGLDFETISNMPRDERQYYEPVEENNYTWTKDNAGDFGGLLHYGWIDDRGGYSHVGPKPEGVTEALHQHGLLQDPSGAISGQNWTFGAYTNDEEEPFDEDQYIADEGWLTPTPKEPLVNEVRHPRNWGEHYDVYDDPDEWDEDTEEYANPEGPQNERPVIFDGKQFHLGEPNSYHWDLIENTPGLREQFSQAPMGGAPQGNDTVAQGRYNPASNELIWHNKGKYRRDHFNDLAERAFPGHYDGGAEMGFGGDSNWVFGKTANKLEWLESRPDKAMATPEGKEFFQLLKSKFWNDKTDPLFPWLWREYKKHHIWPAGGTNVHYGNDDGGIIGYLAPGIVNHWADWFASGNRNPTRRGVDLMQMSVQAMEAKMREWQEHIEQQQVEDGTSGGKVLYNLPNGWTVRELGPEDLAYEGNVMGHCVGGHGYDEAVRSGNTRIISLRDEKGEPHATMELEGKLYGPGKEQWVIEQVQGKSNVRPKPEYQAMIKQWITSLPESERPVWKDSSEEYSDIHEIANPDETDDDPNGWGGYEPHGDYGVPLPHRKTDYDYIMQDLHEAGGSYRGNGFYDPAHGEALYDHALKRNEIPELAKTWKDYWEGGQQALQNAEEQNWDFLQYPGEYEDSPEHWESVGREHNMTGREAYDAAYEQYAEAQSEIAENVPHWQAANHIGDLLSRHYSPESGQYENPQPQPTVFSSWQIG